VKQWTLRAGEGWLPPNWAELAANWIFIPSILLDGILYNCKSYLHPTKGITGYWPVLLMSLDTILFLKFGIIDTLEAYQINYIYKIRAIFYSFCEFMYTIVLIFLFIFINGVDINRSGTVNLSVSAILVLIVAILHPLICRFTSMALQGIKSVNNSKRIKSAPKVRLAALNLYVRWFWFHPLMLLLNAIVYGGTMYLYISIYTVSAIMQASVVGVDLDAILQGCLLAVIILANIFTVFYMINLAYALLKRLGTFFGKCCGFNCNCWKFQFDCSTYAKAMNQGLQECGATFRMNNHMECS